LSAGSPFAAKLREKAGNIRKLLKQYEQLRYGDETWRLGDAKYRETGGESEEGAPPHTKGKPPEIYVISSPRNIFAIDETEHNSKNPDEGNNQDKDKNTAFNPLLKALTDLGEINRESAKELELENRYQILVDLGIRERYNCAVLLKWARQLAAEITYILESREIYSAEVKAIYPELLTDLEIARSTCDQLTHTLARQNGVLTSKQYTEIMSKLLHYTQIALEAANQLADHHEEFMSREVSPLETSAEVEWVFKGEGEIPPKKPKEAKSAEEEEKFT